MRIERTVRYGFVGAIGVTAISVATTWLYQVSEANVAVSWDFRILTVGVLGTAVSLMFLFALLDLFVDEKLEARGIAGPEERGDDAESNPVETDQQV